VKSIRHLGAISSNLYYGWFMVGIVSAMRMLGGGLHGYGFTVFFLPVSEDLGLNRTQTSLAFSLARAEGAIEAPVVGYLVDRFGPKPLMVTAALFAGVGYIALSWIDSYTGFLITYLGLISLAYSAGFIQTPMVVANNWFIRKRARAMTVVGAAVTVGGTSITPLLAAVVNGLVGVGARFLPAAYFCSSVFPLVFKSSAHPKVSASVRTGTSPL
jgi:MFS family permease